MALPALLTFVAFFAAQAAPDTPSPQPAPPAAAARDASPLMLVLDVAGGDLSAEARSGLAEALTLLLVRRLAVDAYSKESLRERVGLASEQQLAGCDASACMAELADALGARFVVFSRIVELGGEPALHVEVFDKDVGHAVAVASVRGRDARALGDRLSDVVDNLVTSAAGALPIRDRPLDVEAPTTTKTSPLVGTGLWTAGLGLGVLGIGVGLVYVIDEHLGEITDAGDKYAADPSLEHANEIVATRAGAPQALLITLGCGGLCSVVGGGAAALVGGGMATWGWMNPIHDEEAP